MTPADLDRMVARHAHDGLGEAGLRLVLTEAAAAAARVPSGPFLEIGSLKGNTAVALLETLDALGALRACPPPLLVTVDPYGDKPYRGGDVVALGLYGDAVYAAAKHNLARFPNHAHFLAESEWFLWNCQGMPYWRRGKRHELTGWAFAFVDGEHDAATVMEELRLLVPNMARGGTIVVDNVDKDPVLEGRLAGDFVSLLTDGGITVRPSVELGPKGQWGARQAIVRVGIERVGQ